MVTRADVDAAIQAREDARVEHVRVCRLGHAGLIEIARREYVNAYNAARVVLDHYERHLSGDDDGPRAA